MSDDEEILQFSDMGLDGRLLKSIGDLGWQEPTMIQEKAIPLALDGKDILARGRTGCGKTGAFLIPILNKILDAKTKSSTQKTRAIILAPSKELTSQIAQHANDLNRHTSREITVIDVSRNSNESMTPLLADRPDIVVTTPAKLLAHLKNLKDIKSTIEFLVIDEADLMFSFGYEKDIKLILDKVVPDHGVQSFLVSATLNPEVAALKKLVLKNAVTLKLEESDLPDSDRLTQYHVSVEEDEKFVILCALFKLNLIRGRTIIFVCSVDRCYKTKLFLEQFGVRTCVLNSELPVASRCHTIAEFNKGTYDVIIASDEKCAEDPRVRTRPDKKTKHAKGQKHEESGVARGIDFQFVSNVINLDFPQSVESYIHRVGRTARGARDSEGTALSFVSQMEYKLFEDIKTKLDKDAKFRPYEFKMEQLDGIKYRTNDALRAVTKVAVREARLKEIKRELMLSKKLETYFKDHKKDLKVLRLDRALYTVKHQEHMKDVPEYIVPPALRALVAGKGATGSDIISGPVPHDTKRKRKRRPNRDESNPLKSFKVGNSSKFKKRRRKDD